MFNVQFQYSQGKWMFCCPFKSSKAVPSVSGLNAELDRISAHCAPFSGAKRAQPGETVLIPQLDFFSFFCRW